MVFPRIKKQPVESVITLEAFDVTKRKPQHHTVLVTGGTEGIGCTICKKLKDMGYIVAATYQNEHRAREWQVKMEQEGYLFYIYPCNLDSFDDTQRMVNDVTRDLGPIDILVNAAAMSFDQEDELDSAFNITCSAMDHMLESGFGRIINISFTSGQQYGELIASDTSLHKLTQKLAPEVSRNGITVNTISPGTIAEEISIKKFRHPEDVANIVSFLASEESGFITGVNIPADGGDTGGGIYDARF